MTGPDHYAEAERLLALAGRHSRGATYDPEWTPALAAAQVHATLALAAATAVGTAGPEGRAWADVAATKPSASEPQAPDASGPESGPGQRRPPPLFPPEAGPRHPLRQRFRQAFEPGNGVSGAPVIIPGDRICVDKP